MKKSTFQKGFKKQESNYQEDNKQDEEGTFLFDLESKQKVRVKKFKGKSYIDIRSYWKNNGEDCPTKKGEVLDIGVSISIEQWKKLKEFIPLIDAAFEDLKEKNVK